MRKGLTSLYAMILVFLVGCAPYPERKPPSPYPSVSLGTPLLPQQKLDQRIALLEEVMRKRRLLGEDELIASDLLRTYRWIKKTTTRPMTDADYQALIRALFHALDSVDLKYLSYSSSKSLLAEQKGIVQSYLTGDYQEVITQTERLKKVFGPRALSPDVALAFALSLGKKGMLEEAVKIGMGLEKDLKGKPDRVLLLVRMLSWQRELGRKQEALLTYGKLKRALTARQSLLQRVENILELERKEPAETPPALAEMSPPKSLNELLEQVEALSRAHRFSEARALLVFKKEQVQGSEEEGTIDRALSDLDRAQEKYLEKRISMISRKRETLTDVRKLFEQEKYEEALSEIESLEKEQEIDSETKQLKKRAIERIIGRERKLAAKSFLMAKQTSDPGEKERLLQKAYDRLKALLEKYPSSPLRAKIQANMEKVREELERLHPATEQ